MRSLKLSFLMLPVFAAAGATSGAAPKANANTPAPAAAAGNNATVAKAEPKVLGVSTAVPLPSVSSRRGNKSVYDLSLLTVVGASLGIQGRKKENLTSTVSSANRNDEFATFKKNEDGSLVYSIKETKDQAGNVISRVQGDPIVISRRHFFAVDTDPKTDPDGADVRIFRGEDKVIKNA